LRSPQSDPSGFQDELVAGTTPESLLGAETGLTVEHDLHNDFQPELFSDIDSYSGANVTEHDWRLLQVKSQHFTSSDSVTQYWHWRERIQHFEHHVLVDTNPVKWGFLRDDINFHVSLKQIAKIRWNDTALRVHLVMKDEDPSIARTQGRLPRGDIGAVFKRKTTVRRFIRFCESKGITTEKEKDP
jgi:hypothetical protein